MNFLEMCQRVRSLAGIQGAGPVDVTTQTGEYERIVNWVKDAWVKIQIERGGKWKFLVTPWTVTTNPPAFEYEFRVNDSIKSFDTNSFTWYLPGDGADSKEHLNYVEYQEFERKHLDYSDSDYPLEFTITPTYEVKLYPVPDDEYIILADGFAIPTYLAANTDEPAVTDDFHLAIVYRALMDYAGYEEIDKTYQYAAQQYQPIYDRLVWDQLYEREELTVVTQ